MVHPNDSVLGALAKDDGSLTIPGLNATYKAMIEAAFLDPYWNSNKLFDLDRNEVGIGMPNSTDEFTLMEMNFSLFWGLSILLYESTLVSDDSAYDRFVTGDTSALTAEEQEGMAIFFDQGKCGTCHRVPELTVATIEHIVDNPAGIERTIERMGSRRNEFGRFLYDGGFYNTGVRPTSEDIARGGAASDEPLSWTRFAKRHGEAANRVPSPPLDPRLRRGEAERIDGSFKVPTLRNTELNGSYYHNGGQGTLLDVVEFYTRGGDFFDENIADVLPSIGVIGHLRGNRGRQIALAKFMGKLTDERVRFQRAPFDHPQLFVPEGHVGDQNTVTDDGTGRATERFLELEPVGAEGSATPLRPFLGLPPEGLQASLPAVQDKVVVFATHRVRLRRGAVIASGHVVVHQANSDEAPPPFQSAPPGTQDVTVDQDAKRSLAAGDYGAVTVMAGGVLTLTGGNYNIAALAVASQGQVQFDDFTQVRIAGRLQTGTSAIIRPSATSSEDACGLVLYVAGTNGHSGALPGPPQAARIGEKNVVHANIYVPNGTLTLAASTRATGAFMGRDVEIGPDVRVVLDSRLEFPPKRALELAESTRTGFTPPHVNARVSTMPGAFSAQRSENADSDGFDRRNDVE